MRGYKSEGIILKRVNLGEADRILTIFTKHYGKIKAIAKGVRQVKSRKGGNLELFNDVILYLSTGKNFDVIMEVEVVKNWAGRRSDLNWVSGAFQIAEVTDKLLPEREPSRRVFFLLKNSLAKNEEEMVVKFEIELLQGLGFGLPKDLAASSVERFIENIIEKRLQSKKIWR